MPRVRSSWRRGFTTAAAAFAAWSLGPGSAAPTRAAGPDYARANVAIVEAHVIPRYQRFATAAAALETAASAFCRAAAPRDPATVRAAYHAAMDAWMAVEHIKIGPVQAKNRRYRIQFWPDRNGLSAKQIRRLLAAPDERLATPQRMASARVSIQGFPAVEFLLFDPQAAARLASGSDGDYACRLLTSISGNLARMSRRVATGWSDGAKPFVTEIRSPSSERAIFENHRSVTAEFVETMHFGLNGLSHLKVGRPLGDSLAKARPRASESWRSRRSFRNIIVNLEALRALYEGENGIGLKSLLPDAHGELRELLSSAFVQTIATARSVDKPFSRAVVDPAARPVLERLSTQLRALAQLIGDRLAPSLGTPLGFNDRDGD